MILGRANQYLARRMERSRQRRGWISSALEPIVELLRATTAEGKGVIVLALVAGGLGMEVGSTQVYLVWAALVAILVSAFVVRRPFHLDGVRIAVHAPRRVTLGQECAFTVLMHNQSDREHHSIRLAGPFLSWDGRWTTEMPVIGTIRAGQSVRVECRARFSQRGHHELDPFRAGAVVPMGLTLGRLVHSRPSRFTVVPSIARVGRLTIPSARRYQPGGVALASRTGDSLDLLGVRPYRPGDPVRDLHARTWARVGMPVVREYQEQYYARVALVLDTEPVSARQFEAALSLTAGVVAHLNRSEALIDLLVAGPSEPSLTLGRGLAQVDQALDLLACTHPGPSFDAPSLARRTAHRLPRLSSVVLIVCRPDEARLQFARYIEAQGVTCRVLAIDPPASRHHHGSMQAKPGAETGNIVHVRTESIEEGQVLWL